MFAFYQGKDLLKAEKEDLPFLNQISYFFIIGSIANISWIFFWHYYAFTATYLSLIAMLLLLFSLIMIYIRLEIGKTEVTKKVKYFIHVPFSVYLGWITVATIANATAVLVTAGWDGFGISEPIWTILVVIVATIITILIIFTRKDIAYSLVIVWAFLGIIIKRLDPIFTPQIGIVIAVAICTAIIVASMVLIAMKQKKS